MTVALFITLTLLWLAAMARIEVSFRLAMHELDCIHAVNMDLIDGGYLFDRLPYPEGLGRGLFDLTLWTKAQIRERRIIPAIIEELP
jgi:hypothetical protein